MSSTPYFSPASFLSADLKELLFDIARTVRKCSPSAEFEYQILDRIVLQLYWRSLRLFEGVILLLDKGLPEEALLLARSLFVESLWLEELRHSEKNREAKLLWWANNSISEQIRLFKMAHKLGIEEDPTPMVVRLENERKQLEHYRKRHGIKRLKKFLSPFAAAKRYGRTEDYWTYEYAHECVHASDSAFIFSRRKRSDGVVAIGDRTLNKSIVTDVAKFSVNSFVHTVRVATEIFGWSIDNILDDLIERVRIFSS